VSRLAALGALVAPGAFREDDATLSVYSYDGALDRGRPDAVVFPKTSEEVRKVVAWCAQNKVPFTARGAGTNLSGGCIPLKGGVVLALAGMNKILDILAEEAAAVVEPGVVNLSLQRELEKIGAFYAPDPASFKVSTIGGNAAENAGGPRCLKYGVTTNHVLAVEAAMPDGTLAKFSLSDPGPELASLLVGAEGTLGVITKVWVKTTPIPATILTLLAGFPSLDASIDCVAAVIASGVVPRVLEAMDRTTVESVETYVRAGYPKTEAVLLIELDGDAVEADRKSVEALCTKFGATELRSATDPAQREKLWEGRRGAYAAMARLAPNVMVEDGVVPRDKLPEIVRFIQERTKGMTAGLLFHAGDGNIHPNIAYDERDAEQTAAVKSAGHDILRKCVELGGSLSGEHGIGMDKREAMAWLFTKETLDLFRRIKTALDPDNLANPEKLFPLTRAGEGRKAKGLSPAAEALRRKLMDSKEGVYVLGAQTRLKMDLPRGKSELRTTGLTSILDLDKKNFTLTVEAGISPRMLMQDLQREGFYLRLPDSGGTLGGLLATKAWPWLRDDLIGMRVLLGNGDVVELGGKVVKNVAGYDVPRLMLGSWGGFGVILDATFKLHSRQTCFDRALANVEPFTPNVWHRKLKEAFDPANVLNPWLFA
jgi:glycolate oxidase